MFRRAILSGSVVLCALTAMATGEKPDYSAGWAKDPWDKVGGSRPVIGNYRPPLPRSRHEHEVKEFAIPSGRCYTGVVIVPARSSGSQRFTFFDGRCEFPAVVEGGQSFVIPFAKGWRPDCTARVSGALCDGDFEAWAITDDGPVRLEYRCR
jgi:hypothetical protein